MPDTSSHPHVRFAKVLKSASGHVLRISRNDGRSQH